MQLVLKTAGSGAAEPYTLNPIPQTLNPIPYTLTLYTYLRVLGGSWTPGEPKGMLIAPGGHEGFSGTPLWKIREQRRPQWSAAALGSSLVFLGVLGSGLEGIEG